MLGREVALALGEALCVRSKVRDTFLIICQSCSAALWLIETKRGTKIRTGQAGQGERLSSEDKARTVGPKRQRECDDICAEFRIPTLLSITQIHAGRQVWWAP